MELTIILGLTYIIFNIISYFIARYLSNNFWSFSFGYKILTCYLIMILLIVAPFGSALYIILNEKMIEEKITDKMNDIIKEKENKSKNS